MLGLVSAWPACLGEEVKIVSVPEMFTRQRGYFTKGRFGQALWYHSLVHGLGYPVAFGADRLEAGTISLWLRVARQRWAYDWQRPLTLGDGRQTIRLHVYSGHPEATKLRPRYLRVSVDNAPGRPRTWYHANTRLAPDFHQGFHHVLFTWKPGESAAYIDGKRVGGKREARNWLAPFKGNAMRLTLTGYGAWYDEIVLLSRFTTPEEAKAIHRRGRAWQVGERTALYLPFDGSLLGQAAIPAKGSGLAVAWYTDTTDNHFLAHDPTDLKLRVANCGATDRRLRVRGRIENLDKEVVCGVDQPIVAKGRSVLETAVRLKLDERGLFWADLKLADEAGATVAATRLAFAVTLGPDVSQYAAEDIPNGMVISQSSHAAPGQKWAGFESLSSWRDLEYKPGRWDFSDLDMVVAEAVQNGQEPHLMLYGSPDWQSTGDPAPARYNRRLWAAPRENAAWVDYVSRMARRYKGQVRTYEVWNEPYWNDPSGGYFYGTADRYAELVRVAADAVHAIDPAARVVSGMGGPESWRRKVARGTAGKADLYGTHPYPLATRFDADEKRLLNTRAMLKDLAASPRLSNTEISDKQLHRLAVHADGRPMTAAEFGRLVPWDTMSSYYRKIGREGFHDHFTSAAMLVRSHVMSLAGGCEYIMWWNYTPGVPGTTFKANTPSLQSVAYANFAGIAAGHRFVRRIDLGADYLKAYLFEHKKTGRSFLVAWADKEPETVRLDVGQADLEVLDIYGIKYAAQRHGPLLTLGLTMSPVYVRGLASSPKFSEPILQVSAAQAFVYPGETATLNVSIYNPLPQGIEGAIRVALPAAFAKVQAQRVRLAARQKRVREFTLAVPDTAAGSQPVVVTLDTGAAALGRIERRMLLPVRLRVVARPLARAPRIDGDLTEWGAPEEFPIRIDQPQQVAIGTPYTEIHDDPNLTCDWKGPKDLRLAAALAYDADNLYLAVRVWDDVVVNVRAAKRPPLSYEGDCVELFLDARKPDHQGQRAYTPEVFHIMVVPPVEGHPAPMFHLSKPRHGKLKAAALDAARLKDGYTIEMRLPRTNFPSVQFAPGAAIGFDIAIDDSDNPDVLGRKSQLVWAGDGTNHADASVFGRLLFE